jgi:hypothetical protein
MSDGTASGLLTLPAFLATQAKASESSPIYRGKFVREQLLCQELPSPPANVPQAPEVTPGSSTRDRLKQHEVAMECAPATCSSIRSASASSTTTPSAATARWTAASPSTRRVRSAPRPTSTARSTASASWARSCRQRRRRGLRGKQWFRYAMGRAEGAADACSIGTMAKAFHDAGTDLRTLPMALAQTPAFLYRRPLGSN